MVRKSSLRELDVSFPNLRVILMTRRGYGVTAESIHIDGEEYPRVGLTVASGP